MATHDHIWFMYYNWPVFPALIAVLLFALHCSGKIGQWLDCSLMQWTAKLSYGIYLWHMVVLTLLLRFCGPVVLQSFSGKMLLIGCAVIFTDLLAAASYYLIEEPAMRWVKNYRQKGPSASGLGAALPSRA